MNEKKPLFPYRVGRVSYAVRYVLFLIMVGSGSVFLQLGNESTATGVKATLLICALVLLLIGLVAIFWAILMPRLRDAGLHPALSLLIFVPLLNLLFGLALLFIPPDAFTKNRPGA